MTLATTETRAHKFQNRRIKWKQKRVTAFCLVFGEMWFQQLSIMAGIIIGPFNHLSIAECHD